MKGKCFETAMYLWLELAEKGKRPYMIHANIIIDGEPGAHAWVELDGYVFDYTQRDECKESFIENYYSQAQIQRIVKYDAKETLDKYLAYLNFGPWDNDWLIFKS